MEYLLLEYAMGPLAFAGSVTITSLSKYRIVYNNPVIEFGKLNLYASATERQLQAIRNVKSLDGFTDVFMHGTATTVQYNGKSYDAVDGLLALLYADKVKGNLRLFIWFFRRRGDGLCSIACKHS